MKQLKTITLVMTSMVLIHQAKAEQSMGGAQKPRITELQVRKAIKLLVEAEILGVENNELVVKRPSILEELEQLGRVESGKASPSAICLKEM